MKESLEINCDLVKNLILEQFPFWANLSVRSVDLQGWDNRTFRLGDEMLVRLPSGQYYAPKVHKEQKWLPFLAKHLSFSISEPVALGEPSENYPWNWSVYKWIKGESLNCLSFDEKDLERLAVELADFLIELQQVDIFGAPPSGNHNGWRGGPLEVYDEETRETLIACKDLVDVQAALNCWETALSSRWNRLPVWIHGDLAIGNILAKDGKIAAIIDWGGMAVGDPACDLVIAWTFLDKNSRKIFRQNLNLDDDTWARARGWALWKALITLRDFKDKSSPEAQRQLNIIYEIIIEHQSINCSKNL